MTPESFAEGLLDSVVDENVAIYRQLFKETQPEAASDPYWKRALGLYRSLPPHQQVVFFQVIRQVAVDTTSNVLGVLDGVNPVGSAIHTFTLTDDEGETLSGDLQGAFLVAEEDRNG